MTQIGNVYGEALYQLAAEEGITQTILEQLQILDQCFSQDADFLRLLSLPNISKQERCQILDHSFQAILHPYVLNFLKLLSEKGYTMRFSDCYKVYRDHYNLDNGILPVAAVTAIPLTDSQQKKLSEKLSNLTGKTIELENPVDATVLGGIRLEYGGTQLDNTIAHRLDAIGNLLKNTVL